MYTILLVDDEYLELEMLEKHIDWAAMGFVVAGTALNGRDGLARVRELRPDVVLTDIKMPVMDGIALSRQIYQEFPQIRQAFLSGYSDFSYAQAALRVEAVGYLLKPVDPLELAELMALLKKKLDETEQVQAALPVRHEEALRLYLTSPNSQTGAGEARRLLAKRRLTDGACLALATIDEYDYLARCQEGGGEIIRRLENALPAFGEAQGALTIRLGGGAYALLSPRPLTAAYQAWAEQVRLLSCHLTYCAASGRAPVERLPGVMARLKKIRTEAVYAQGANQCPQDAPLRPHDVQPPEQTDFQPLLYALLHGKGEEAQAMLDAFFRAYEGSAEWRGALKEELTVLTDTLYSGLLSITASSPPDTKTLLMLRLLSAESLPLLRRILNGFLEQVTQAAMQVSGSQHGGTIEKVKQLIEASCAQPLTIDLLAERAFLSPNYLRTVFKAYTGRTVLEYVTDVRMEKARALLTETGMKINRIAESVGYENASHFCASFHKKYGLTPNQFRARQAKEP